MHRVRTAGAGLFLAVAAILSGCYSENSTTDRPDRKAPPDGRSTNESAQRQSSATKGTVVAPGTRLEESAFDSTIRATGARWIVVQVFAEACGPCMTEALELTEKRLMWNAQGIEILGLGMDDSAEAAKTFDENTGGRITFPLYSAPWFARQQEVTVTPTLFLYDSRGQQLLRTDPVQADPSVLAVLQNKLDDLRRVNAD